MSIVVEQGKCINPKCRSHDAGTWYSDGSYYCFSCGYYKKASGVIAYKRRGLIKEEDTVAKLPADAVAYIPQEPMTWLKKYNLTNEETQKFLWSYDMEQLIYPVYSKDNNLVFYWARYFPQRLPKNFNAGDLNLVTPIVRSSYENKDQSTLYAVEDIVSAIKVSRRCDCLCLFGSNLRDSWINDIRVRYSRLVIWLDYDKRVKAARMRSRYSSLIKQVEIRITDNDPKDEIP